MKTKHTPPNDWRKPVHYDSKYWGIVEWGDSLVRVGVVCCEWSVFREPTNAWLENWQKNRLTKNAERSISVFLSHLGNRKLSEPLHYCRYHVKQAIAKAEGK